jgi:Ethylene insensitive 3
LQKKEKMSTISTSNKSEAKPSISRDLDEQAAVHQTNKNKSDARPSNTRQVTIGEPHIQDDNSGSPLSSSPSRKLTREELKMKIDEYGTKIRLYESNKADRATKEKQKASIDNNLKAHQKMVSHYHQKILDRMSMITEQCNAKGYVIGMVTETSKPMIGASDSLRAWWKGQAMFDKTAPAETELYCPENFPFPNVAHDTDLKSTAKLLVEISDTTLGSMMSLLMQHCDPPQRMFPYEKGLPPPWWPTPQEGWWGQTGISENDGPPPFKKPHDLRKKWKVAVIVGIIKLMAPNYSKPYSLVEQSNYLMSRMNSKERKFWNLALIAEAKLYCREFPDMPLDDAVSFLEAYSGSSSQIIRNVDRQSITISGNEAPGTISPFGVVHLPSITTGSSTSSSWPITGPPVGQLQHGNLQHNQTIGASFFPQYSPWAFCFNPMLSANVPLNLQHNQTIGGSEASNHGFQDHHAPVHTCRPFVDQLEGNSTGGTQDRLDQLPGGNTGLEFQHPFGNQDRKGGC